MPREREGKSRGAGMGSRDGVKRKWKGSVGEGGEGGWRRGVQWKGPYCYISGTNEQHA